MSKAPRTPEFAALFDLSNAVEEHFYDSLDMLVIVDWIGKARSAIDMIEFMKSVNSNLREAFPDVSLPDWGEAETDGLSRLHLLIRRNVFDAHAELNRRIEEARS